MSNFTAADVKRLRDLTGSGMMDCKKALLELNCETDFVAKNADFIALAQTLVEHVEATQPADVAALLGSKLGSGRTVAETIEEQSAKIGEKLVVNRFAVLAGNVAVYLH